MNFRRSAAILRLLLPLALLFGAARGASAHNPETSYARIRISADKLEWRFTFDLFTLLKVTALDTNRDGQISREELQSKAPLIYEFLRDHIAIEINSQPSDIGEAGSPGWPSDAGQAIPEADFHSAAGLIHFHFAKPVIEVPQDVTITFQFFEQFGPRHTVLGVFEYDGNEHEVTFTRDEPDYLYDTGYQPSLASRMWKFLELGVEHIFLGYDHILFLLALIVVSRLGDLVRIVTSFTIAHSITLILAALNVVRLPSRLVETAIAATIMFVALQNIFQKEFSHRWVLTFFFGLIHGFGFANVLREMGLPTAGLVRCLVAFNVGVEIGQLAIVLVLFPVSMGLAKWRYGHQATVVLSALIFLFGLAWFIERAFALQFMPF